MTDLQLANVLQFFVVIGFWVFVLCKMIPESRLDGFRQAMFVVRDELFDYAADGNVPFDHPAYVLLRRQMNGFIRYGHHLTFFRIFMTHAIHKISETPVDSGWHETWLEALDTIKDSSVRKSLEQFHRRSMVLAISRVITGSLPLMALTGVFLMESLTQGARQSFMQLAKNAGKKAFSASRIGDRVIEEAAHKNQEFA